MIFDNSSSTSRFQEQKKRDLKDLSIFFYIKKDLKIENIILVVFWLKIKNIIPPKCKVNSFKPFIQVISLNIIFEILYIFLYREELRVMSGAILIKFFYNFKTYYIIKR